LSGLSKGDRRRITVSVFKVTHGRLIEYLLDLERREGRRMTLSDAIDELLKEHYKGRHK